MPNKNYALAFMTAAAAFSSTPVFAGNPYNMDDRCMPFYQEYASAVDGPKAFVAAKNGRCGSWHGAPSAQEAKAKAMDLCKSYGGVGCKLVEHVDQ